MRRTTRAVTAALCAAGFAGIAPTAHADTPNGRSFTDLAQYGQISCTSAEEVVGDDLIVNPGGGNVAWLPDGTELVGTSFAMYDAEGQVMFVKTYGGPARQQDADVTCTSTGSDPDSGATVTVVFTAAAIGR